MASATRVICKGIPMGVVLTISAQWHAGAQTPGADREPPPPYRPAAGAKDLRAVLFNWAWSTSMLHGVDEHKMISSLEYQGKGTIRVERRPGGQTYSNVEVVSGRLHIVR